MSSDSVSTIAEYLAAIEKPLAFLYRGVPDASYELIPSVGRQWSGEINALKTVERTMFREFQARAVHRLTYHPKNDWEWLMLAQHHGMPTRLLDWTANPLVALYFACREDYTKDSAVYLIGNIKELDTGSESNPFEIRKARYISPPHVTPRLGCQSGFFTVSPDPRVSLKVFAGHKVIIPGERKLRMCRDLSKCGIHAASLFPDPDGLAAHIAASTTWMKSDLAKFIAQQTENAARARPKT